MFEAVKFTESHVNSRYQATVLKEKIRIRAIAPLDACQQLKELIKQITDTDLGIMGLVLHCACMLFDSISKENANMVEHCGELVMSVLAAMRPRMLLVECTLLGDTLVAIERWLVSLQQHFGAADFIAGLDRAKVSNIASMQRKSLLHRIASHPGDQSLLFLEDGVSQRDEAGRVPQRISREVLDLCECCKQGSSDDVWVGHQVSTSKGNKSS